MSSIVANKSKYILYSYWRSGASWRVRIALAFKGISFETCAINLLKNEQTSAEFAKLNPQKRVPLLVIDEKHRISQSMAILDYLENAHPEAPKLFPADPCPSTICDNFESGLCFVRAQAVSLAESINADTQPLQGLQVLARAGQLLGDKGKEEWGVWAITKGLEGFEADIQSTAGKYCIGDSITIADVMLVPQLGAARRFPIDLTKFPTCLRIEKELSTHPAFIAGHPNSQPDKPADITI